MMFMETLKKGMYDIQEARDEYILSSSLGGNINLLWRFMDVQKKLITLICPNYAKQVSNEVMKKDDNINHSHMSSLHKTCLE